MKKVAYTLMVVVSLLPLVIFGFEVYHQTENATAYVGGICFVASIFGPGIILAEALVGDVHDDDN